MPALQSGVGAGCVRQNVGGIHRRWRSGVTAGSEMRGRPTRVTRPRSAYVTTALWCPERTAGPPAASPDRPASVTRLRYAHVTAMSYPANSPSPADSTRVASCGQADERNAAALRARHHIADKPTRVMRSYSTHVTAEPMPACARGRTASRSARGRAPRATGCVRQTGRRACRDHAPRSSRGWRTGRRV